MTKLKNSDYDKPQTMINKKKIKINFYFLLIMIQLKKTLIMTKLKKDNVAKTQKLRL